LYATVMDNCQLQPFMLISVMGAAAAAWVIDCTYSKYQVKAISFLWRSAHVQMLLMMPAGAGHLQTCLYAVNGAAIRPLY